MPKIIFGEPCVHSFRATKGGEHSTRGRPMHFRFGHVQPIGTREGLASQRLHEGSWISACPVRPVKSEIVPAMWNMAKMKSDSLQMY